VIFFLGLKTHRFYITSFFEQGMKPMMRLMIWNSMRSGATIYEENEEEEKKISGACLLLLLIVLGLCFYML
jgi:hypothetical protein